jgi:hypothetical protein
MELVRASLASINSTCQLRPGVATSQVLARGSTLAGGLSSSREGLPLHYGVAGSARGSTLQQQQLQYGGPDGQPPTRPITPAYRLQYGSRPGSLVSSGAFQPGALSGQLLPHHQQQQYQQQHQQQYQQQHQHQHQQHQQQHPYQQQHLAHRGPGQTMPSANAMALVQRAETAAEKLRVKLGTGAGGGGPSADEYLAAFAPRARVTRTPAGHYY